MNETEDLEAAWLSAQDDEVKYRQALLRNMDLASAEILTLTEGVDGTDGVSLKVLRQVVAKLVERMELYGAASAAACEAYAKWATRHGPAPKV